MLNHSFHWNGHDSSEFGIKIERFPGLNRPARKYTVSNIPGRNGNLYDMQDAWEEVIQSYEIYAGGHDKSSPEEFIRIMEWLSEPSGYSELTDTYDANHYREAVFLDTTDIANSWNRYGRAAISFRCRPERFLNSGRSIVLPTSTTLGTMTTTSTSPLAISIYKTPATASNVIGQILSGEVFEVLSSYSTTWYQVRTATGVIGWVQNTYVVTMTGSIVNNPTKHIAKPMLSFSLTGSTQIIRINDVVIHIPSGSVGTGTINCENEDVLNMNSRITVTTASGETTAKFLKLDPGKNYVIHDSEITMNTRFWEL